MDVTLVEHESLLEIQYSGNFEGRGILTGCRGEVASHLSGRERPIIALNLSGVPSITSSAIGDMVTLKKRLASAGGDVVLVGVPSMIMGVLQMNNLHRVLAFHPSVEELERHLKSQEADEAESGEADGD
jgi:anti-anti-sigma factor